MKLVRSLAIAMVLVGSAQAFAGTIIAAQSLNCGGVVSIIQESKTRFSLLLEKTDNSTCSRIESAALGISLDIPSDQRVLNLRGIRTGLGQVVPMVVGGQAIVINVGAPMSQSDRILSEREERERARATGEAVAAGAIIGAIAVDGLANEVSAGEH